MQEWRMQPSPEMQQYLDDGERRAFELGNRGPVRFVGDGALHPDIVEAYWRCGFYVFESVFDGQMKHDCIVRQRRFGVHRVVRVIPN